MAQQQTPRKLTPSVPKPTALPPRPNGRKARPPHPDGKSTSTGTSSTNNLKLVHAPILSDDDLSTSNLGTPAEAFDLEASLTLPSNVSPLLSPSRHGSTELTSCWYGAQDELLQSFSGVESCIRHLLGCVDSPDFLAGVSRLRELVDSFVGLSSFLQSDSKPQTKGAPDDVPTAKLRAQLFDELSSALLENWTTNAACVLELTPSLLALYSATGSCNDDRDRASAQIIKLGKTLFVLSKDSANDSCFCNVSYVEAILHAIAELSDLASGREDGKHSNDNDDAIFLPAEQHKVPMKTLVYAAGTLKNVSSADDKMARLLATNRAIAILSETMLWRADAEASSKEIAQFLIQTTGILRNLSVSKSSHKQFLEARIPRRLCGIIPAFIAHQELMVNVSRILSKLTLHERPRAQINQRPSNVQSLVALVDHRQNSWLSLVDQQRSDMRFQDLLFVRVFFVLGNLCAGNDQNRRLIAASFNGVTLLLEALQFYAARYSEARNVCKIGDGDETEERRRAAEGEQAMEVLIKLVRVVANLAINADVGAELNRQEGLTTLLDVVAVAQRVGDEELMLNAVSCITNVSYYSTAPTSDSKSSNKPVLSSEYCFIESNRTAITQLLSRILLDRNEEAVVEATRAFGNLSRFKDVLEYMAELRVLDCLVVLLDHSNREVVYTVCGVLMNAALDSSTRRALLSVRPLVDNDAVDVRSLLVGIVECAAADDLEMTLIASKALYNLLLATEGGASFSAEAVGLCRTIEEVYGTISEHRTYERACGKSAGEPNEDEGGEQSDSWRSRQELRLVLPQLLRSVNARMESL